MAFMFARMYDMIFDVAGICIIKVYHNMQHPGSLLLLYKERKSRSENNPIMLQVELSRRSCYSINFKNKVIT